MKIEPVKKQNGKTVKIRGMPAKVVSIRPEGKVGRGNKVDALGAGSGV
jgi:hypothetical protein